MGVPAHLGKLASEMVNDYRPQFPLRLTNKDFGLILKAAREHVLSAAEAAFSVSSEEWPGDDDEDFSAVLRRMEDTPGFETIPLDPLQGDLKRGLIHAGWLQACCTLEPSHLY